MPKLKTHQGTKKRVNVTKKGKFMREKSHRNHFLAKKGGARKRQYGKQHQVPKSERKNIKRALGE